MKKNVICFFVFISFFFFSLDSYSQWTVSGNNIYNSNSGNVSIGSSTSYGKFNVFGNSYLSGNLGLGTTSMTNRFNVSGNSYFNGNIGIGTGSPIAPLQITRYATINGEKVTAILGNDTYEWTYFGGTTGGRIRGSNEGYLSIESNPAGASDKRLFLNHTSPGNIVMATGGGNVAIGLTSTIYKLDVNGHLRVRGTTTIDNELYLVQSRAEGPVLHLENPLKTNGGARVWKIFNMTGNYGNSLQFWAYETDDCSTGFCGNRFTITDNGYVGIGTQRPTVELDVVGAIRAHAVKVCLNQGCDFVFEPEYNLMPLNELHNYITTNKHLPEVAPAALMESEGIDLAEMNAKLLQKIEELTLYAIAQNKRTEELEKKVEEQTSQINKLAAKVK